MPNMFSRSVLSLMSIYALLHSLPQACSQTTPNLAPILDDQTDAFINKVISEWKSPGGVAIAFVRKNGQGQWENIETKGYGIANSRGDKVTKDTTFNLGSNSKLFTVVAAGLLINNQTLSPRISWDSKAASIIPGFNLTDPIALKQTTLLDLASHRTGYPRHDFCYRFSDDVPAVLKRLQYLRQSTEFRTTWQYSNNMYTVLSYLPTALTGQNFARYVKQYILNPLNMTATTYSYELANSNGQRAEGMARQGIKWYSSDPFAGKPRPTRYWSSTTSGEDGNILSGAGGIISNAVDVATWLQTLLLDGVNPLTNQTVIPAGTLQLAASGASIQQARPTFPEVSSIMYGAGLTQLTYRGHLVIEHPGFVYGFNSQIARLPNDNFGVAVLTNDHDYGRVTTQIIKYYIMDRALGLNPIDWNGRLMAQSSIPPTAATPRSVNATLPDADFQSLAGKYSNPAYGEIELCLVSPENPFASAACQALAGNLSTILPNATRPGIPTFYYTVDSPWYSHMRMEHFNGNFFNMTLLVSTPTNDPAEPYWTFNDRSVSDNQQTAEVEVNGTHIGIGMAGFWSGQWVGVPGSSPKPTGNTTRERAEYYFDKI